MNPSGAQTTNRLILAVLTLILMCLVVLLVRAFQKPDSAPAPSTPEMVNEPAPRVEPVAPRPSKAIAFTPRNPATATAPVAGAPASEIPDPTTTGEPPPTVLTVPVLPQPTYTPGGSSPNASRPSASAGSKAGTMANILGFVTLLGTPKPEIAIDLGPTCGRINTSPVTTRHFVVNPTNRGLANVVVFLRDSNFGANSAKPNPDAPLPLLDQVGCQFEPYIMAVQAGYPFRVRNSDPEMHNIHLTPQRNPERNFGQPVQGQVNTITLANPELFVRIKCDVHPWMFAYVTALDNQAFAVTDSDGLFRLSSGLAEGTFTIVAAHQKAGLLTQEIKVSSGKIIPVNFQFLVPDPNQSQAPLLGRKP